MNGDSVALYCIAIGIIMHVKASPNKFTYMLIDNTCVLSLSASRANRIVDSQIIPVNIGDNKSTVVITKSAMPYSSGVNIVV